MHILDKHFKKVSHEISEEKLEEILKTYEVKPWKPFLSIPTLPDTIKPMQQKDSKN